jgi:putative ABC transport system permease protein
MQEVVDEVLSREHQQSELLSAFAILALILAATGLYGVIAYAVSQRRREFGVRIALGAGTADVLRLVFGRGLALVAAGIIAGILLSLTGATLLRTMLHGVAAHDPGTLLTSAALLGTVALAACIVPAVAAARVQPATVLRDE